MTKIKNHLIHLFLLTLVTHFGYTQVPMADYLTFTGHVDFTIFGTTNNIKHNEQSDFNCQTDNVSTSSQPFVLPASATIRKALLYWAGSGTGDFNVKLSGPGFSDFNIDAERTFLTTIPNAPNQTFFSGTKDVTELLQLHGTGDYTLSELDADREVPYCNNGHLFSGWFIIVVYAHPDLAFANITKIYDGFEGIKGQSINFSLNNLNILSTNNAKLGFVSWEGEEIAAINEWMKVNGHILSNSLNPNDNLFNGSNSYTNSMTNYNMDIDYFDISNYIHVGDSTIDIKTFTQVDLTIFNVFAVTFVNKAPNATVAIKRIDSNCDSRDINIKFELSNTGNDSIPPNMSVGFYANNFPGVFLGNYVTTSIIAPQSSITISTLITIPDEVPDNFSIVAVADDLRLISELNETDNTSSKDFTLYHPYQIEKVYSFCSGDTLFLNDIAYSTPALDTFHLTSINDCDSLVYVDIRQHPTSSDTIRRSLCDGDSYIFPDGSNTDSVGLFSFYYLNRFGCDSLIHYEINSLSETHSFDLGSDQIVKLGKSTIINPILNFEPDSIIWSPELYLEDGVNNSKIITPLQSIEYFVTTIDSSGCTRFDSITIQVFAAKNVFFPNVFSPNNDGFNDIFKCFADNDVKQIKRFLVFNRWGNIVFQQYKMTTVDKDFGWNGRYRSEQLQPDVYTYLIEIEFLNGDVELFTGDVTLLR